MSHPIYRSARLFLKGTGAPLPNTEVRTRGSGFPSCSSSILSMSFGYRWRDKDYGDECIEDWCFDVHSRTNFGIPGPFFMFWRNWVYIGDSKIFFGHFKSFYWIEAREDNAYLVRQNYYAGESEQRLACTFQKVVEIFKQALIQTEQIVQGYSVFQFPIEDCDGWNSRTLDFTK
jgi:hypothetical protein